MILPFEHEIPIKAFNHHVSLLGGLLVDKSAIVAVYNNFVNLRLSTADYLYVYPTGYDRIDLNYDIVLNIPTVFDFQRDSSLDKFIGVNRTLIDNGFYVDAYWDEFYVPECSAYQKFPFRHNYVMYGYDNEFFYFAAYTRNRKPETIRLPYETFYQAAERVERTIYILRKYNRQYTYVLDPMQIVRGLDAYLEGRIDYCDTDTRPKAWKPKVLAGIDCIRFYMRLLEKRKALSLDMRPMRSFLEHKQLMADRIAHVYSSLNIEPAGDIEGLQLIASKMGIAFSLALKYQLTENITILDRVHTFINV